jgi:hypothetical protein
MEEIREYELSRSSSDTVIPTYPAEDSVNSTAPPTDPPPPLQPQPQPNSDEPRILTFADLQALIESGREDLIPNNKIIPDTLNVRLEFGLSFRFFDGVFLQDAPPSQSTAPVRKKPWELAGVSQE